MTNPRGLLASVSRRLHAAGPRLRRVSTSLGPRRTAVLVVVVLAAGTGAAVALTGGRSNAPNSQVATRASGSTTTQATGPVSGAHSRGSTHRARNRPKHVKHPAVAKSTSKPSGAGSARSSHHGAAPGHTNPSTRTTGATSTTSTTSTTTSTPAPGPTSVSLHVYGGGNAYLDACGNLHHFRTYPAGTALKFTGAVAPVPAGRWKVELHITICQGGAYQDFEKIDAHINPANGAFDGTFSAPPSGLYDVIPVLYLGSVESKEGDDVHIETR